MRRPFAGVFCAAAVLLLGVLAVASGRTQAESAELMRRLGTLLTLISGVFSALWWHQSAELADRLADEQDLNRRMQHESNVLNGAAATSTALALIAGVLGAMSWGSLESYLAAGCFLVILATSGAEFDAAIVASFHRKMALRPVIGLVVLVLALSLFLYRCLLPPAP